MVKLISPDIFERILYIRAASHFMHLATSLNPYACIIVAIKGNFVFKFAEAPK